MQIFSRITRNTMLFRNRLAPRSIVMKMIKGIQIIIESIRKINKIMTNRTQLKRENQRKMKRTSTPRALRKG
jgi:hypothetical protein